ncbi:hypothetical protein KTR9_5037 (plasmid) [Gordonia sp. KTR9]|nr:hypothetical protein KTR9_5037 [Gordonia sp. KTR9]
MAHVVGVTQSRRAADLSTIPGVKPLGRTSFECSARRPGMVCVIGSEADSDALLGSGTRCAVGHLMVPSGPEDDLSAWRQAWHAVYPLAIGGAR